MKAWFISVSGIVKQLYLKNNMQVCKFTTLAKNKTLQFYHDTVFYFIFFGHSFIWPDNIHVTMWMCVLSTMPMVLRLRMYQPSWSDQKFTQLPADWYSHSHTNINATLIIADRFMIIIVFIQLCMCMFTNINRIFCYHHHEMLNRQLTANSLCCPKA